MRLKILTASVLALHMGLAAQITQVGASCDGDLLTCLSGFHFNSVNAMFTFGFAAGEVATVAVKLGPDQTPASLPAPFAPGCMSYMGSNTFWSMPAQFGYGINLWTLPIGNYPILNGINLTAQAAKLDLATLTGYTTNAITGPLTPYP